MSGLLLSGFLIFSGCQQSLTDKSVAAKISKAQKSTARAKKESTEAIEARKALFMQNRETQVTLAKDRIKNIDKSLSTLNSISKKSPNQSAVNNVNSAMTDFDNEKVQLNEKINAINAQSIPNWEPAMQEIIQSLDKVENNLNTLNQSLDYQQVIK